MRGRGRRVPAMLLAGVLFALSGCGKLEEIKSASSENNESVDIRQEIENAYNRVKSTGASVPDTAIEWATEDIGKIGDWDYRVVRIRETKAVEIEKRLNEFGRNRWEVFWIDGRDGMTLYMKRTARSYLKHVPLRDVLKAIPVDQGE